ncbi:hypothetical protein AVEN_241126-1 [Araneus ventricosus]|uniref:Uncharacterized protein n=1 Tax=Araneus ventricosus TaxID=182803 RepID=A0A4Y2PB54_ARAVE|nr:hypothetical protein AVEN_241126-1 [Araneus ventricosus]
MSLWYVLNVLHWRTMCGMKTANGMRELWIVSLGNARTVSSCGMGKMQGCGQCVECEDHGYWMKRKLWLFRRDSVRSMANESWRWVTCRMRTVRR